MCRPDNFKPFPNYFFLIFLNKSHFSDTDYFKFIFFIFFVAFRFVSVFAIYYFSVLFFYFGSVYGCSVEFIGRMFRFGLAWLVRSN